MIICPIHGKFGLTAGNHKNGSICPKCRLYERGQKLIKEFKKIHNNKYDYSKTKYEHIHKKIIIICPIHGEFKQEPNEHRRKRGCPTCAGFKKALTQDEVIKEFIKIHGDKYDYSEVEYKGTNKKITIICPIHGEFYQIPKHHKKGMGCRECANCLHSILMKKCHCKLRGWAKDEWINRGKKSKYFDGFKLYKIRCWNEEEEFYKIGITFTTIKKRFASKHSLPYKWEVVEIIDGEGGHIYDLEKELHKQHKEFSYIPNNEFEGMTECFEKLI